MNTGNFRRRNGVLILLCILLCAGLMIFLAWNHRQEQEIIQQLREKSESSHGIEEEIESTASASSKEKKEDDRPLEKGSSDISRLPTESEEASDIPQASTEPKNSSELKGISIRGDSFGSEDKTEESGIGKCLSDLLSEQGKNMDVMETSMDKAGSLSQLKRAGVSQSELDSYVTGHKNHSGGGSLNITEVKIRDLTEEEMMREDQDYLPVVCIGYYGGWGNNLDELCEQQQKLLETYHQQEKYLILGVYPSGWQDKEAYTAKMEEVWGEHFVQLDGVLYHSISTDEGKKVAAQLIYEKMLELGYIS